MRKIVVFMAAVLVAVACDKADIGEPYFEITDVVSGSYYFKADAESEKVLTKVFGADEGYFSIQNDYMLRQALASVDVPGQYEIFKNDGTFVCSNDDLAQSVSGRGVIRCFSDEVTYLGVKYSVRTIFPDADGPYYPYEYCGNGEPLTTICTANNYWKIGDSQDCNYMAKRQYYATDDLNADCGAKSYYTRIFFGGVKHSSSNFWWWNDGDFADKDAIPRSFYDNTITGLRLVVYPGGQKQKWTPEQSIKDPETGIVWELADIYFDGDEYYTADNRRLGADLNDGGGGDFLYLYYTKDTRTGRKLMLTNPFLKKNASIAHGPDGAMAYGTMGTGLLTWNSHTWKVNADDLLAEVGNQLRSEFTYYYLADTKRVDFIRLYNRDMTRHEDYEYPANFNRNAHGKDEIFISYSFITPEDTFYWDMY